MTFDDEILKHLKEEYSEGDIMARIDAEIINGGWGDGYEDEDDCNNEYDYYHDFCNGEAEDVVIAEISKEISDHYKLISENYTKRTGEVLSDKLRELITSVYPDLNH